MQEIYILKGIENYNLGELHKNIITTVIFNKSKKQMSEISVYWCSNNKDRLRETQAFT